MAAVRAGLAWSDIEALYQRLWRGDQRRVRVALNRSIRHPTAFVPKDAARHAALAWCAAEPGPKIEKDRSAAKDAAP